MTRFDGRVISGVGVFAAAVETGSFVRTSEVVGLTTSGVSRAIGRLEERLGTRLFHRTPQGIRITEDGRRFYEQTLPLLEQLAQSASAVRSSNSGLAGTIRLNADSASSHFLLPVVRSFTEAHPEVNLRLEVQERPLDPGAGPFDLAMHLADADWPGAAGEPLFESESILCASRSYLRAKSMPSTPAELTGSGHTLLLDETNERRRAPWLFTRGTQKVAIEASRHLSFNTPMMVLMAAVQGGGIAKLPRFVAATELEEGRLVRLLNDWHAGFACTYVYCQPGGAPNARTEALLKHLRTASNAFTARTPLGMFKTGQIPPLAPDVALRSIG
jgi:DNA-binding transcriptional LysR family regulator